MLPLEAVVVALPFTMKLPVVDNKVVDAFALKICSAVHVFALLKLTLPPPTQVSLMLKQPLVRLIPFANVDEAIALVTLNRLALSPQANVEVAELLETTSREVEAKPVTARYVVVAFVVVELIIAKFVMVEEALFTTTAPERVERPTTVNVPCVAMLPLLVVVALPFTMSVPVNDWLVDDAYTTVVRPVTVTVPPKDAAPVTVSVPPVVISVLIVVALKTAAATKNTDKAEAVPAAISRETHVKTLRCPMRLL